MENEKKTYEKFEDLPDILTAQILASFLRISDRRAYDLMDENPDYGGIKCKRIGKKNKRVLKGDLAEWLKS